MGLPRNSTPMETISLATPTTAEDGSHSIRPRFSSLDDGVIRAHPIPERALKAWHVVLRGPNTNSPHFSSVASRVASESGRACTTPTSIR
eukprot:scaffold34522_cov24-Tisochrysis_lutea.AAC.1